jgi:hypothetical protein
VSTSTTALVSGAVDLNGPNSQSGEIDVTTFDSTAKEYLLGLRDEGTISVNFIRDLDSTGQARLITDQAARNKRKLIIDFSTHVIEASAQGSRLTCDAYCQSFGYALASDDAIKSPATFRITGALNTTKQTS